jgi:hypothetical protein
MTDGATAPRRKPWRAGVLVGIVLLTGCAARVSTPPPPLSPPAPVAPAVEPPAAAVVPPSPPLPSPPPLPPLLLTAADEQMISGNYRAALRLYEEFVFQFPDHVEVPRAQAVRATLDRLFAVETAALRLERDLAEREDELGRLKRELVTSRLEIARLRADLERLKLIDLRLERQPVDGQNGSGR